MKRSMHAARAPWRIGAVLALATAATTALAGPPDSNPDPSDPDANPGAATTALNSPGVLPAGASDYLSRIDQPRLSWPGLYEPDGTFVPESTPGESTPSAPAMAPSPMSTAPQNGTQNGTQGGDTRGVVRRVDREQGKVSIKHGPIAKLDMPGMTMVFRARDPALLDGLQPGDEVDFDVEIDGTTFFITGVRKQEASR